MDRRSFIAGAAAAAALVRPALALTDELQVWNVTAFPGGPSPEMRCLWSEIRTWSEALSADQIAEVDLRRKVNDVIQRVTGLRPPFIIRRPTGDITLHGVAHHPDVWTFENGEVAAVLPAIKAEFSPDLWHQIQEKDGHRPGATPVSYFPAMICRNAVVRDGVRYYEQDDGYRSSLHRKQLEEARDAGIPIQIRGSDSYFHVEEVWDDLSTPAVVVRKVGHNGRKFMGINFMKAWAGEFRWRPASLPMTS